MKPTPIPKRMRCLGWPSNWLDQSGQYLFVDPGAAGGVSSHPLSEKE